MVKRSDPGALAKCPFKYQIGDKVRIRGSSVIGEIIEGYCGCDPNEEAGTFGEITYDVRKDDGSMTTEFESNLELIERNPV